MSTPSLRRLRSQGQSLWLDFIDRPLLESGGLSRLITEDGISGLTSNPAIFEQAFSRGSYDEAIDAGQGSAEEIASQLMLSDIKGAAQALEPVWRASGGDDGFVSIEVSPHLADDSDGTVAEAMKLRDNLSGHGNIMIKVPGTRAGVSAFEQLTALGVCVNVTLLFSTRRYAEIAEAWQRGLERRLAQGEGIDRLASVASFFVSRIDTAVDRLLDDSGGDEAKELRGRTAIANAARAYLHLQQWSQTPRFAKIKAAGGRVQRLLWASTGTKDPAYSDTLYVDELIAPDTVNTLPTATLAAFRDQGAGAGGIAAHTAGADGELQRLADCGIDLEAITDRLERDGIKLFADAWDRMLASLASRRKSR